MGYNLNVLLSIFLTNRKITFFHSQMPKKMTKKRNIFRKAVFNISQQKKNNTKNKKESERGSLFRSGEVDICNKYISKN